jgi:threonine aldolase
MDDGWIDLRSDTVTKPTVPMRKAMYEAEVGDDGYGDDPTVNRLQERSAEVLGKDAALFVSSGTMGNLISLYTQTDRGQEIIVEERAHVWRSEAGHLAAVSGLMCQRVSGGRLGIMDPADIEKYIRGPQIGYSRTALISIESTNNGAGGTVIPADNIRKIAALAADHRLAFHIDGARIFNATVALSIDPADYVRGATSVTFCLSKSLCCPFGSLILGGRAFIEEATHWRVMFGGTLRQGGIMAAAGLVALDHMIDRLAEDHINARRLAEGLTNDGLALIDLETVQTNMVRADFSPICSSGSELREFLWNRGVKVSMTEAGFARLVTHYWVSSDDILKVLSVLREFASDRRN